MTLKPPKPSTKSRVPKESPARKRIAPVGTTDLPDDEDDGRKPPRPDGMDESKVGYGNPPVEHRFVAGKSGNPRGREKGRKTEATMLKELLEKKVTIREAGRERKITLYEAILRRLAEDSLKGNIKSANFLLSRYGNLDGLAAEDPQNPSEDDAAVLKAFAEHILAETSASGGGSE